MWVLRFTKCADRVLNRCFDEVMKMNKPVMVYDGECAFCKRMISKFKRLTCAEVRYRSYQKVAPQFSEVSIPEFEKAVYYFEPDGQFYSGSDAVFQCLRHVPRYRGLTFLYSHLLIMRVICRLGYWFVARNRLFVSKVLQWLGVI